MKKIGIIVFLVAMAIGISFSGFFTFGKFVPNFSFFSRSVKGNGNTVTEKRNLSNFSKIDVGGIFEVEITTGELTAVEVIADENLQQYIDLEKSGDRLEISTNKRISSDSKIVIKITAPDIEAVDASGAASVRLNEFRGENLNVELSGAAKLFGAGMIKDLSLDLSGASQADTSAVDSAIVSVDASGASKASVKAVEKLSVDLSGASRVDYSGNPKELIKNISGGSHLDGN